jgi:hypothetical protein
MCCDDGNGWSDDRHESDIRDHNENGGARDGTRAAGNGLDRSTHQAGVKCSI